VSGKRFAAAFAVMAIAAPVVLMWEGTVPRGYVDPVGIVTACTGHTKTAEMRRYSESECDELLVSDLWKHNADIEPCIKVDIPPHVRAAMLSFSFNVGAKAFCESTMARKLNAGDTAGACAELSRWVYAGGRVLPGLVKRRKTERELCEGRS